MDYGTTRNTVYLIICLACVLPFVFGLLVGWLSAKNYYRIGGNDDI